MVLHIELDREDDGRWIAEVLELVGVMVYASSREEALRHVQVLALHALADQLQNGEVALEPTIAFEAVEAA